MYQSVYSSYFNWEKRMSVIVLHRAPKIWMGLAICLLASPLGAQSGGNTQPPQQASQSSNTQTAAAQQSAAPGQIASAPQPRNLPSPTNVDYSRPARHFPNPLRPYMSRTVPPPVFTNAPRV